MSRPPAPSGRSDCRRRKWSRPQRAPERGWSSSRDARGSRNDSSRCRPFRPHRCQATHVLRSSKRTGGRLSGGVAEPANAQQRAVVVTRACAPTVQDAYQDTPCLPTGRFNAECPSFSHPLRHAGGKSCSRPRITPCSFASERSRSELGISRLIASLACACCHGHRFHVERHDMEAWILHRSRCADSADAHGLRQLTLC